MKIQIGFIGGDKLYQKIIKGLTGSQEWDITHCFVYILDSVLEADGVIDEHDKYMGVWLHNPKRYSDYKSLRILTIDIPNVEAAKQKSRELLGTGYGYIDGLSTVAKFLMKFNIIKTSKLTVHCSELVARVLRAGGVDVCHSLSPDEISPVQLYLDLLNRGAIEVRPNFNS